MEPDKESLVVLNREDILGRFKKEGDAQIFAYITALHADVGDMVEIYQPVGGYVIGEEKV